MQRAQRKAQKAAQKMARAEKAARKAAERRQENVERTHSSARPMQRTQGRAQLAAQEAENAEKARTSRPIRTRSGRTVRAPAKIGGMPHVGVTRPMKKADALATEAGRAAMEDELGKMARFKVWDPVGVSRSGLAGEGGIIVPSHMIFSQKQVERQGEGQIKCRLVATGNRLYTPDGAPTAQEVPYASPVSLSGLRAALATRGYARMRGPSQSWM